MVWNERAAEVAQASAEPAARRWLGMLRMNRGVRLQRPGRQRTLGRLAPDRPAE